MSLKLFMISEEFEAHAAGMITAIAAAGQLGMLTLLHCEDAALVRFAGEQLMAAGRGELASWAESLAGAAERAAVDRAVAICEATGSPVYIVHLSSAVRAGAQPAAAGPAACRSSSRAPALPLPDQRGAAGAGRREVHRRAAAARAR